MLLSFTYKLIIQFQTWSFVSLCFLAADFRNNCEVEEGARNYINGDPGDTTRKTYLVEVIEEEDEDEHDYEEPEDEDENDYEDPEDDEDNYMKPSVSIDGDGEEDSGEEESSSDEHDYVNLAQSVSEQTLYIYGEQQDIYQNL